MSAINWLKNAFDFDTKKKAATVQRELKEINQQLVFAKSTPLTLGVEFELALINKTDFKPAYHGVDIVSEVNLPTFHKEGLQHMVELTTSVCANTQEADAQMAKNIQILLEQADKRDLLVTGTGRPPTIKMTDYRQVEDPRYQYQLEGRKIFTLRFGALGTHIHIGMKDSETCIRYHNFYMHFLPHMIALAASSPFEDGIETGLASIRPTVAESMPISGMPYNFGTWQEYVSLCQTMYRAKSIRTLKDLWWDLRPSPRFGTLELRVCDQFSNIGEAMAVVAFMHALGLWFEQNQSWLDEMPRPSTWRLRENKWRALRYGLDAHLVTNNLGDTTPVVDDIKKWLDRIQPQYSQLGYQLYQDMLLGILTHGNSAKRQQQVWDATGSLEEVALLNCRELRAGKPLWSEVKEIISKKETQSEMAKEAAVA
jgi:carboxylate-amine ligase